MHGLEVLGEEFALLALLVVQRPESLLRFYRVLLEHVIVLGALEALHSLLLGLLHLALDLAALEVLLGGCSRRLAHLVAPLDGLLEEWEVAAVVTIDSRGSLTRHCVMLWFRVSKLLFASGNL